MIRMASAADAEAIADIIKENIEDGVFSITEQDVDGANARAMRLATCDLRHPTFVHVDPSGDVLGWGSLGPLWPRPSWSDVSEIGLYVRRSSRSRLVGAQLLVQLLDAARARRFTSLVAVVLARNAASLRGLRTAGFEEVARLQDATFLYGQWVDVVWLQKELTQPDTRGIEQRTARFRTAAI